MKQRGFTLIELMVVIAIVAILAAIAIPAFADQLRKSRRSDAVRSVSQLQLDLEKWRANCATYADSTPCKDFNGDGTVAADEGKYPTTPLSDNYTIAVSGQSATAYVITATPIGAQAKDPCRNFILTNTAGVITKTVSSGLTTCW